MKKVFLGGTVNKSKWRDWVMPRLKINYFNPVVENWNEEAYQKELFERAHCDYCLYILTPKMTGFYSIAEVVDDSNKRPDKTIICVLPNDEEDVFSTFQYKSLNTVAKLVEINGGKCFSTLDEIVGFLNNGKQIK